jgi:LPXTG-motif cell wall-anchored protein
MVAELRAQLGIGGQSGLQRIPSIAGAETIRIWPTADGSIQYEALGPRSANGATAVVGHGPLLPAESDAGARAALVSAYERLPLVVQERGTWMANEASQKRNTMLMIGGGVLAVAGLGFVIYRRRRRVAANRRRF